MSVTYHPSVPLGPLMQGVHGGKTATVTIEKSDGTKNVYSGRIKQVHAGGYEWDEQQTLEIEFVPEAYAVADDLKSEAIRRGYTLVPNEAIQRGSAFVIGDPNDGGGICKVIRIDNQEEQDDSMQAIIITNERNRTVDVALEVRPDVFLDSNYAEVERKIGTEMPVWYSGMPVEVLHALQRSSTSSQQMTPDGIFYSRP